MYPSMALSPAPLFRRAGWNSRRRPPPCGLGAKCYKSLQPRPGGFSAQQRLPPCPMEGLISHLACSLAYLLLANELQKRSERAADITLCFFLLHGLHDRASSSALFAFSSRPAKTRYLMQAKSLAVLGRCDEERLACRTGCQLASSRDRVPTAVCKARLGSWME